MSNQTGFSVVKRGATISASSNWTPNTAYVTGDICNAPEPSLADDQHGETFNWYRKTDGTSGATFDFAEKNNWQRMTTAPGKNVETRQLQDGDTPYYLGSFSYENRQPSYYDGSELTEPVNIAMASATHTLINADGVRTTENSPFVMQPKGFVTFWMEGNGVFVRERSAAVARGFFSGFHYDDRTSQYFIPDTTATYSLYEQLMGSTNNAVFTVITRMVNNQIVYTSGNNRITNSNTMNNATVNMFSGNLYRIQSFAGGGTTSGSHKVEIVAR